MCYICLVYECKIKKTSDQRTLSISCKRYHTIPVGPLPKTLVDFWRLVWQERTPSIVMITNLEEGTKIKCQRYWPESGRCRFGPFEVTLTDEQILADYTIRKLQVQVRERKCFCVSISNIMNVVDKQISSCCAAKF